MKSGLKKVVTAIGVVVAAGGGLQFALKPRILVINQTSELLRDVELRGRGFSKNLAPLRPGASECVTVSPSGESSLVLVFTSSGRRIERGDLAYLEPNFGYRMHVVVGAANDDAKAVYDGAFHLTPWCVDAR